MSDNGIGATLAGTEWITDTFVGIATTVAHSTLPTGEYGEGLLHVATFNLGGTQQICIRATRRLKIGEGEMIAVAGAHRGSVLRALAYENLSTHTRGNAGKFEALVGAAVFPVFALFWASGHVAVLGAIAGAWCLLRAARISLAERDLRHEVSRRGHQFDGQAGTPHSDA